jgi:tetratricopeptide (TPR) repeat protein
VIARHSVLATIARPRRFTGRKGDVMRCQQSSYRILAALLFCGVLVPAVGCDSRKQTKQDNVMQAKQEFEKGNIFEDKGDHNMAIACYTKAIRLDPTYADAYLLRGLSYRKKGMDKEAKVDSDKYKSFYPL